MPLCLGGKSNLNFTTKAPRHKELRAAFARLHKSAHEQTALQRQIEAVDAQIDRLVYELYGLTDDEIEIVEQATRKE